eukprot:Blabericola_migrator_1__1676@NODE_144_length_13005_cov_119_784279_g125_i0_p13_GENE_NODE_144_length_13005_cov_119_784279_g125_i0NODE_144_length_13005_cov_119_784279_g125_i0_p13_ORF_typecomplete_len105_score17_44SPC12/PF06645_13/5_9e17ATG22/PF11700_8/0_037EcsB/PF05975_12/0_039DUF4335/PF14233_6/0_068DUF2621/PF11084_8/0_14Ldr_toxin/PF13940_6/0_23Ldr_toxin/PF13940_6/1_7e02Patched/PF02460_18/1_1_NODE_144_length_13005_cov_119_784279_g125_i01219312507
MFSSIRHLLSALKSGEMDFEGQQLASVIMWDGMAVAVVAAIIYGSITRSFEAMIQIVTIAAIIIGLMIIPSWPMFQKNLLHWQPAAATEEEQEEEDEGDEQSSN